MPLLRFDNLHLAYGDHPLLKGANFQIDRGERVALLGRNGVGKSSLLKILSGKTEPDDGTLWKQPGLLVGVLNQSLPAQDEQTVFDLVASGLGEAGSLLAAWNKSVNTDASDVDMGALEKIQQQLEAVDGWSLQQKVETVIDRLKLPAGQKMSELSGGWRRRVELAQALVCEPELLLLDEPTNHLDIITIDWLEKQLLSFNGALLFITHDRAFLQSLSTRIVELDRGLLTGWECDYPTYLRRKREALEVEEQQNALFDRKLAEEERWIRQGIKARRTRNEGRVRALQALRKERSERVVRQGVASFSMTGAETSGKRVIEADSISHSWNGQTVVRDFSVTVQRGDKIGLIGANGVGKTTLLNILLGELQPDSGTVKRGTRLDVAYFDQLRDQLDLEQSVIDNVAGGRERIDINGTSRHVISYLGDFLFPARRCRVAAKVLSGGERNRLLLAKLFSKSANLLVMDEPTNDLDVETLELLESLLVDFAGTVILVSHDRVFLDNVVTSTLVFEQNGRVGEYVGGFDDWLRQGGDVARLVPEPASGIARKVKKNGGSSATPAASAVKSSGQKKKLSYRLQRELDALPAELEELEQQQSALEAQVAEPSFYQGDHQQVQATLMELEEVNRLIDEKMERWEELEQS